MPEVSGALTTQTWVSTIWTGTAVPIISAIVGAAVGAVLTWLFAMRHERSKAKALASKELQKKIEELEERLRVYEDVEQATDGDYYLMKATGETICPTCWGAEHKAIPVRDNGTGYYNCAHCSGSGVYSRRVVDEQEAKNTQALDTYLWCN